MQIGQLIENKLIVLFVLFELHELNPLSIGIPHRLLYCVPNPNQIRGFHRLQTHLADRIGTLPHMLVENLHGNDGSALTAGEFDEDGAVLDGDGDFSRLVFLWSADHIHEVAELRT